MECDSWKLTFRHSLGQGKTQFDDFDNANEMNQNRDWCIEFMPSLIGRNDLVSTYPMSRKWNWQRKNGQVNDIVKRQPLRRLKR